MAQENPLAKKYGLPQQQPAQSAPPVIYGPPKTPDPLAVNSDRRADEAAARAAEAAARAARAQEQQILQDERDFQFKVDQENYKREQDAQKGVGAQKSATQLDIEAKAEGAQKRKLTADGIMAEVKALYKQDIKGQPLSRAFGAAEYIPFLPANERFSAAGNSILPLIRPLVAQTAKEGDSDKEMQVFMAYVPQASDSDITIEQKFKMLDILLTGMVDGKAPSDVLAAQNGGGNVVGSVGEQQAQRVGMTASEQFDMNQTEDDNQFYFQRGFGHTYEQDQAFKDWLNSNVGQPLTPDQIEAKRQELGIKSGWDDSATLAERHAKIGVPDADGKTLVNWGGNPLEAGRAKATEVRRGELNEAGQNTAFDAALGGLGDAVTLGWGDELTGMTEGKGRARELRLAQDVYREDSPIASIVGGIGGSLLFPIKGGSVGKVAAQGAAYGAAYGAGSGETIGQRTGNALMGGALGGVGGAAGEKLMQSGVIQKGFNALRPTPPTGGGGARNALAQAAQRQNVDLIPADVGGRGIQKLTSAADQSFISSGTVAKAANRRTDQLSQAAGRIVDDLGGVQPADDLGEVVRDAGQRYATSTRQQGNRMYSEAKMLSKGVRPKPIQTIQRIDEHIAELSTTPEASRELIGELSKVKADLTKAGGIPVDAMKRVRSGLLEAGLKNEKLRGGNEQRVFSDVADAIGADVEAGLRAVGRSDAADAFKAADAFWRRRVEFIDNTLEPIIGAGKSGEQIVAAMQSMAEGKGKGVRTLRGVMDMMEPSERSAVQASVINRLGRANSGGQNMAGDAFSANTFMTNWDKLSGRGKSIMFPREHRAALDDIATLAERVKNTNSQYNFSGSGGVAVNAMTAAGGAGVSAGTGNLWPVVIAAAIQYGGGKLLASARVARYLSKAPTTATPAAADKWAKGLQKIVSREPVLAADARGLQQELARAFSESRKLAADDQQDTQSLAPQSR